MLRLFYEMVKIRVVEETIASNYFPTNKEQEMRCPTHLSIGQEASAVGVISNLRQSDWLFGTHRSHSTYIAKGGCIEKMIAELMGKKTGCLNGRGGSMHLKDLSVNYMMSVPIVGSVIPVAAGFALGAKMDGLDEISVVYFGDGAMEEGAWHEAANFCALKSLPILFVCENNLFSVYSHIDVRQPKTNMTRHAKSHGIQTFKGDGNSLAEVDKLARKAIKVVRGGAPCFLELSTYRHLEHCGPNNDDHMEYRSKTELKSWLEKDPIKLCRNLLLNDHNVSTTALEEIYTKINLSVAEAFKCARNAEFPEYNDIVDLEYPPTKGAVI